jgi:hypothetical protein
MRLFSVLPVLGLLLGTRASSHDLREPAPHRLDVRVTSTIIDVCVLLQTELVVPGELEILTAVGWIGESIFSSSSESTCQKSFLYS